MRAISLLLCFVLLVSTANAWGPETLKYVSEKVLLKYYPLCKGDIDAGAVQRIEADPQNATYGEPYKQHCDLQPSQLCPAHDAKWCETSVLHCQAPQEGAKWFTDAKVKKCCEQAKYLATAIFYHVESKFVFNNIVREDPSCHANYETDIDNAILENPESFSVTSNCTSPPLNSPQNTFDEKSLADLVNYAEVSVIREGFQRSETTWQEPWYSYDEAKCGLVIPEAAKLADGAACEFNANCTSAYCDHDVCCASGTCCPVPGAEGFPCETGMVCSQQFKCVEKRLADGKSCAQDIECASRYCETGTASGVKKYCCAKTTGSEKCCASQNDCLAGQKCLDNVCVGGSQPPQNATQTNQTTPTNETAPPANETGGGEKKNSWCPIGFAVIGLGAASLFLAKRKRD